MTKSKTIAPSGRKESESITFRIDFEVSLSQYEGDPSDYITVYQGEVIGMMDDDNERKIGRVVVYLVERGRVPTKEYPFLR